MDISELYIKIPQSKPMVIAILLLVLGLLTCLYGLRVATGARRPIDLLGSLLAAGGLALAVLGVGRLLSDRFFSG